jgi:SAM-dependent methyltransferase
VTTSPDRDYWEGRALKHGRLAGGYLDPWNETFEQPLRWSAFKRICPLEPGLRVLDVGCGTGRWSVRMADLGAQVLGADISSTMIEMAEPHPSVEYRVAAAHELDCPDRHFDVVVSVTVLQHITDPGELDRALQNLRRMLKDAGRFFVLEYSPLRTLPSQELTYMRYRTHRQWIELMAKEGFRLRSSMGIRFIGRKAYGPWRRLRGTRALTSSSSGSPAATSGVASGEAAGMSGGDAALLRAAQAVERGIGRVGFLRQRSDLHAYVFVKTDAAGAEVR